jgi:signal transduction histidine kinase
LVEALRDARARIEAAASESKVQPGEAAVARRLARDLERALARIEAGEADRDLISIICHDLKDPLASIVMGAGFLRKTAAVEDPTAARVVGAIARSADRMSQLVGDFHDLAKLEEGRLQVERRACDVIATLRGGMGALEPVAKEKSITLELEAPESPSAASLAIVALCDAARLVQVVGKLAANSFKFTPQGGRVTIRVERGAGEVRISVRDTGRGIAEDRLPTIFDHVANARRVPRDGPGLGLAIVRGLVELQGGSVAVRSRIDEGSTFTVTLPAVAPGTLPANGL